MNSLCDYGCGKEYKYIFKNGKVCCSISYKFCSGIAKKISISHTGKKRGPHSEEVKNKIRLANKGKKCTEETIKRMSEAQRKLKKSHTKEWKEKKSLSMIGSKNIFFGRKHSEESKIKNRNNNIGIDRHTQSFKEKQKIRMLNGGAAYCNTFIKSPSKPQTQLYEISKELFPSSILQYKINNFCVDIAIPDMKIILEYDCWYWHQDEEKDLKRQKEIESLGWKFIRFRDYIPNKEQLYKEVSNVQTF